MWNCNTMNDCFVYVELSRNALNENQTGSYANMVYKNKTLSEISRGFKSGDLVG